jgi:eukaryotic-like serine/threonine-protein kinase
MAETVGGRYELAGRLGEGGMGCVYRARHLQLGKAFALKLIAPAFALDSSARARFNEEAKLASEISHPNIVSVVDFGEDAALGAYMVMELVEGEPLLDRSGGPMSIRRACDVLGQIADALDHIHRRGIVHGDVKADNILLAPEATGARRRRIARLLDFGLARRSGHGEDEQVNGSPHYLAPERAAGAPPSVSADIYALGVLAYAMLTGTLPFDGNVVEIMMAHIAQEPDSPSLRRKEIIDAALEALVMRAMHKDPARRHATAAAFRYELNTVMDMLELGQRKRASSPAFPTEVPRESALAAAFERSKLPQAMVSNEGTIVHANRAFAKLISIASPDGLAIEDTSLAACFPQLAAAVRALTARSKPVEQRATVSLGGDRPDLELALWLSPLPIPGTEVHLVVRVEERLDG